MSKPLLTTYIRDEEVCAGDTLVVLGHNRPVLRIAAYTGPYQAECIGIAVFPALSGTGESGMSLWRGQYSEVYRVP